MPTASPTNLKVDPEDIKRVRKLLRKRGALTVGEELFLEAREDSVRAYASQRFNNTCAASLKKFLEVSDSLKLDAALAQLSSLHIQIGDLDHPEQIKQRMLEIDGAAATAFDTARDCYRLLAYWTSILPVWESVWADVAVEGTIERTKQGLWRELRDCAEVIADVKEFIAYYDFTMERVRAVTDRVSRIVTVEQLTRGPQVPGHYGQ